MGGGGSETHLNRSNRSRASNSGRDMGGAGGGVHHVGCVLIGRVVALLGSAGNTKGCGVARPIEGPDLYNFHMI